MTTPSTKRQADYRQRMTASGLVQVSGWVHAGQQQGDASILLRRLRDDPDLRPGPLRHSRTGKLHKLET